MFLLSVQNIRSARRFNRPLTNRIKLKIKKEISNLRRNMMVLRVHGDDLMFGGSGGVITHTPRIPQMEMMKVHIPFTFKLHESFKSTYAGKSWDSFTPSWFATCDFALCRPTSRVCHAKLVTYALAAKSARCCDNVRHNGSSWLFGLFSHIKHYANFGELSQEYTRASRRYNMTSRYLLSNGT